MAAGQGVNGLGKEEEGVFMQGQVNGVLMIEVNQVLYILILFLLFVGALRSSHHCFHVRRKSRLIT